MQTEHGRRMPQNRRNQGLTAADVAQIKLRLNLGIESKIKIAELFKVTPMTIYSIANHKTWRDIDAAEVLE